VASGFDEQRAAFAAVRRAGLLDPFNGVALAVAAACVGPTLAAPYAAAAVRHPTRRAVVDDAGAITYRELDRRTSAIAEGMRRAGLAGGRIGLLARNHRGFVEVTVAATKAGIPLVLLNTMSSAEQLAEVVRREGITAVFADSTLLGVAGAASTPVFGVGSTPGAAPATDEWATTERWWRPVIPRTVAPPILLTSGTTGVPRGARRRLRPAGPVGATALLTRIPYRSGDTIVIAPPIFHAWGFAHLMLAATLGGTAVLSASFDPERTISSVDEHQADVLAVVPTMLLRILAADTAPPAHAPRAVTSSGAALPAALARAWMDRFGDTLYSVYGSTEVGQAAIADPADLRDAPGTAGYLAPGTTVAVLDEHDNTVGPGVEGRIFVGSPFPFEGYTGGGGKPVVDGRLDSGDLGYLDENERLFVTGRADDMVITGGEKVHPTEVEGVLLGHPGVVDAAAVGLPDVDLGQRVAAAVVRRAGSTVTADELVKAVRRRLARFAVPRVVVFVDVVPRNAAGKVLRGELAKQILASN
jgi:acyl-CoA synthetase (AMP-forming)/AMP-acid ligase II